MNTYICSDYIKISDITEIQQLLYHLLERFHNICEENRLRYSLYFGSLLGAVRHSAIIPWDDDVDIVMPRPDYNKLLDLLHDNNNEELFLYDISVNDSYAYPFAKIGLNHTLLIEESVSEKYNRIKLFIDVFPMDAVPSYDKKEKSSAHLQRLRRDHDFYINRIASSPVLWKKPYIIVRLIRRFILDIRGGLKRINNDTLREITKYEYDSSDIISYRNTSIRSALRYEISKKEFDNRHIVPFGHIKCWIFDNYDTILTRIFGDYMTPPPEDKRNSDHPYTLYVDRNCQELIDCISRE